MRCKLAIICASGFILSVQGVQAEEYFIGTDLGTTLSGGELTTSASGYGSQERGIASDWSWGLAAGVVLDDSHQVSVGWDMKRTDYEMADEETVQEKNLLSQFYMQYDYLIPINEALYWSVGGTVGYESELFEEDEASFSGMYYGVQTGVGYRLGSWTLSGEVGYLLHGGSIDIDAGWGDVKVEMGNELNMTAQIAYHF